MLLDSDLLLGPSLTEHAPKLWLLSVDSAIASFHNTFSILSKHIDHAHPSKLPFEDDYQPWLSVYEGSLRHWGYLRHLILGEWTYATYSVTPLWKTNSDVLWWKTFL